MKPVYSIVRRPDGLRKLECRFLTRHVEKGTKERVAESRFVRLTPKEASCLGNKLETTLPKCWDRLGEATWSRRTLVALVIVCAKSTAAPTRRHEPAPHLSETPVDLRPWLCDPIAIRDLLLQLRPHATGLPRTSLIYDSDSETRVNDPWFVYRAHERVPLGASRLSALTWERVAGFTKEIPHRDLQEIEDAYHAWDGSPALAEMVIGHCRGRDGANWLTLFSTLPREAQEPGVARWMSAMPGPGTCPRQLVLLAKPAWRIDPKGGKGLDYLWQGTQGGAPIPQLCEGVILWKDYEWEAAPFIGKNTHADGSLVCRLTSLIVSPRHRKRLTSETWEALLKRPALHPSFARVLASRADHNARAWMFRLLREARQDSPDEELDARFNAQYDAVEAALATIPENYRCKAVRFFEAVYWCHSTRLAPADLMQVIAGLCRSPLATSTSGVWVWRKLIRHWKAESLPTSSWRRIDDAWRSHNHADALDEGLDRLDKDDVKEILRTGLRLRVRLTMEVIRLAGQTMEPLVRRARFRLIAHPLLDLDLDTPGGVESWRHILGASRDLTRWCRHLSGQCRLRPEAATVVRDKLEGLRSERLLDFLKGEMIEEAPSDSPLDQHTRLYAQSADENRRAYRKLIRRYCRSGEAGILFHPRNQHWLRTHRFLKAGAWLGGLHCRVRLEDGNEIILELERRFEQVLKMGTLVNSCLALDGCNSHSALANAADINKQVVMAYDPGGKFLARQLVGIAEERRLVCFEVYSRARDQLEPAFSAFDSQLQRILSLPLHRDGEYELKPIVCREWYDDCAWDPGEAAPAKIIDLSWGGAGGR